MTHIFHHSHCQISHFKGPKSSTWSPMYCPLCGRFWTFEMGILAMWMIENVRYLSEHLLLADLSPCRKCHGIYRRRDQVDPVKRGLPTLLSSGEKQSLKKCIKQCLGGLKCSQNTKKNKKTRKVSFKAIFNAQFANLVSKEYFSYNVL